MNAKQLRELVVRPALHLIDAWSESAENLVMGTAAVESRLEYVKQLGEGPALGLFQMEPATHDDIWRNYIFYREGLEAKIKAAISTTQPPNATRLVWDMRYAAIMCRVHYLRVSDPLPDQHDVHAMARYWKEFYNSHLGAGTPQKFVDEYRLVQYRF